jgi:hypothetical protein
LDGGGANRGSGFERGNSAPLVPSQGFGDLDSPQVAAEHSVRPAGPGAQSGLAAFVAHLARHFELDRHAD